MTLDELDGSLCTLFQNTCVFHVRENLNEDLYCRRQRCSPMTLVSANIRFVPIFEGFIGDRASNDNGVIENMDCHGFRHYVFSTLRNETNFIIY